MADSVEMAYERRRMIVWWVFQPAPRSAWEASQQDHGAASDVTEHL